MANVTETASFDAGVYRIETTDPVIGGETGIANKGLKNLANRTTYLKEHVDALEEVVGEGARRNYSHYEGLPALTAGQSQDIAVPIAEQASADYYVMATIVTTAGSTVAQNKLSFTVKSKSTTSFLICLTNNGAATSAAGARLEYIIFGL